MKLPDINKIHSMIEQGGITHATFTELAGQLRAAIKEDPSRGKELGALIARISAAQKPQSQNVNIHWIPVRGGALAIGHKPGGKVPFDGLRKAGANAVVTLLQNNEGAAIIGKHTEQHQMQWIWFPFSASQPHQGTELTTARLLYNQMGDLLANGAHIYIHCSAGIHRTGMITYGLLRHLGFSKQEARHKLLELRPVTAMQVGEQRLTWGDQFE